MKAVIQRVTKASVTINEKTVASIQDGMLVLIGIEGEDTQEDIVWLSKKIARLSSFSYRN